MNSYTFRRDYEAQCKQLFHGLQETYLFVCMVIYSNDPFLLPVCLLHFVDHEHMLQGRSECWSLLPGHIPFMYIFFCLVLPNKNSNKMTVNSAFDFDWSAGLTLRGMCGHLVQLLYV